MHPQNKRKIRRFFNKERINYTMLILYTSAFWLTIYEPQLNAVLWLGLVFFLKGLIFPLKQ